MCLAGSFDLGILLFERGVGQQKYNHVDMEVSEEGVGDKQQRSHSPLAHAKTAG